MKADISIAAYRGLREQPLWRLLAAQKGPAAIALMQAHLFDNEQSLPASVFHERLTHDLDELRSRGEDFPQTAQAYTADWLSEGYLIRRFPSGAGEEVYELSAAAAAAIRFVSGLAAPRAAATESRLAVVMQQLMRLAEETETNPAARLDALLAERERIDREIENVRAGRLEPLPAARSVERIREIIALAEELTADFRRVRDEFERLHRNLRERILEDETSRGDVLESLFAGVDVIAASPEGLTFSAFWRLLTDPRQSASLEHSTDLVMSRDFIAHVAPEERRFLLSLTRTLLTQGGSVHEVLRQFASSLKHFVQSREYLEQRRMNAILKQAQRSALNVKDRIGGSATLSCWLRLTSSRMTSLSQWKMHDPLAEAPPAGMKDAAAPEIGMEAVGELVAQSEIDFTALKANIREMLSGRQQATIAEILKVYPAAQGLGSVIGYMALGSRHAVPVGGTEAVEWRGLDDQLRAARIPVLCFVKERVSEFV